MSQLYASLFYQKDVTDIFSDSTLITYMIQVEVALAQAQAKVGVIPQNAANTIAQVAEQAIEKFDFSALALATGLAGNIAIPFVKQLTAIVKDVDEDASRYVHWGATSQDILDTACILQCRDALNIVEAQLQHCYTTALQQAKQYRHQVMIGRTWLQQALPITLGHKLARWASAFKRDLDRIQAMKSRVLTAQLGGAVGSLASLQDQGSLVVNAFAQQLNLTVPTSTWHAEWLAIPEIFQLCAGALSRTGEVLQGFEVNAEHMQQNLDCTNGLIMAEAVMMALAPKIGRLNAHHLVEAACKTAVAQKQHLSEVVSQLDEVKEHFSQTEILEIFKAENYLGNIQAQIDAVLQEAQGGDIK